jgi:hypothetical protein
VAGTKTLGDLKARIADELDRSDLASQIALAVEDAITEAAGNRFWFNEVRGLNVSLTQGQAYYETDDLANLTQIDNIYFLVNGTRRAVYSEDNNALNMMLDGAQVQGEPYLYSRYAGLRMYPVPNGAYTLYIDGVSRLPSLVSDASFNAWTNEGERLVRAIAKRNLLVDVIRDAEEAQVQDLLVQKYTKELLEKTYDRIATGTMWSSERSLGW